MPTHTFKHIFQNTDGTTLINIGKNRNCSSS